VGTIRVRVGGRLFIRSGPGSPAPHKCTQPQQCPLLSLSNPESQVTSGPLLESVHNDCRLSRLSSFSQLSLAPSRRLAMIWSVDVLSHRRRCCRLQYSLSSSVAACYLSCSTARTSIVVHVQLPTALKHAHIHQVSLPSVHQQSVADRKPPGLRIHPLW